MSFVSDFDSFRPLSALQAASRFDSCFDAYGLSLKEMADEGQRAVTLIARSPASPAAQALAVNLGRFELGLLDVSVIFAQIAPAEALDFLLQSLRASCSRPPESIIRWAKNRALLDAHERLTLGRTLCWTGDSMRRSEDSRSAIDRVDDAKPALLAEANASFAALWKASKPLPSILLARTPVEEQGSARPRPPFALDAPGQGSLSLEDYLRSRRH